MDYKLLYETQPKYINFVQKSFEKKRLAQVFLLSGDRGTPKIQAALFLSNLIFCTSSNNCGVCSECRLLDNGINPNLFRIDDINNIIKKEQIDELEKEFNLIKEHKRVVIINNIDKANLSASNSLLKFLEEMKEDTYAILITSNISKTLNTIKSRAQIINLEKISKKVLEKFYLSKGIDRELASITANITNDIDEGMILINDVNFVRIIDLVRLVNKMLVTKESLVLLLNDEGRFLLSCPDKKYHEIFLDCLSFMFNSRLYYLLNKKENMIFKESILDLEEMGFDFIKINFEKTLNQVKTVLDYKRKIMYNVNLELFYMDLMIKCEE